MTWRQGLVIAFAIAALVALVAFGFLLLLREVQ